MSGTVSESEALQTNSRQHPAPFYYALVIGLIWLILLGGLAFWTANPITINRIQILNADLVVQGSIEEITDGKIAVITVNQILKQPDWFDLTTGHSLSVSEVADHWQSGNSYIFPLTRTSEGGWQVTLSPLPDGLRLDYPAQDDLISDVQQIIRE